MVIPVEKQSPYKYFAYDYEDGFYMFKTQEEAIAHAEKMLQYYRKNGWAKEVEYLCWGEIKQIATMTDIEPWPKLDDCEPGFEYSCQYKLKEPIGV